MATAEITGGRLKLTGDGFGYAAAKRQLPTTPVNAKKMQFAVRLFLENAGSSIHRETGQNWENAFCYGLSWDGVFPTFDNVTGYYGARKTDNFFGPVSQAMFHNTPGNFVSDESSLAIATSAGGQDYASVIESTTVPDFTQSTTFYTGSDSSSASEFHIESASDEDETTPEAYACFLPANATDGALCAYGWEIWQNPNDTVQVRTVMSTLGLANDSLLDIFTEGTLAFDNTYSIDTTEQPHFLNGGGLALPEWVMFRWPFKGNAFHVEHYTIRYWEYST